MYKIMKGSVTLGYVENPTYIFKMDNGSYGLCDESEATGICFDGAVYSLSDKTLNPDNEDIESVMLIKVDGGTLLNEQNTQLQAANEELTNTQLALCEVYEALMGGETNG